MDAATIIAMLGIASTLTMFAALICQTMRADRAEAALGRIEATIAACDSEMGHPPNQAHPQMVR